MDKKTVMILIIAAIVTMILVGIEVYFWKKTPDLEFNSRQAGIDFCNQQISPDQRNDCLIGVEVRFK